MATPRITVGIPTFNRSKGLSKVIERICAQSLGDFELRVSDNASTDDTAELLERWRQRDPRIRIHRNERNLGPVANFDRLRRDVDTEYFLWASDDDEIEENYLEACIGFLDRAPDHVLAAGEPILDNVAGNRKGQIVPGVRMDLPEAEPAERVLHYFERVGDNSTYYGVARTRALDRVPYPNTLGADWLVVAGLAAQGKVRTLDETRVRREHRWGPDSFRQILATQGLPPRWVELPGWIIAREVLRDVAYRSPAYGALSRSQRGALAVRCMRAICRHFRIDARSVLRFYASGAFRERA